MIAPLRYALLFRELVKLLNIESAHSVTVGHHHVFFLGFLLEVSLKKDMKVFVNDLCIIPLMVKKFGAVRKVPSLTQQSVSLGTGHDPEETAA